VSSWFGHDLGAERAGGREFVSILAARAEPAARFRLVVAAARRSLSKFIARLHRRVELACGHLASGGRLPSETDYLSGARRRAASELVARERVSSDRQREGARLARAQKRRNTINNIESNRRRPSSGFHSTTTTAGPLRHRQRLAALKARRRGRSPTLPAGRRGALGKLLTRVMTFKRRLSHLAGHLLASAALFACRPAGRVVWSWTKRQSDGAISIRGRLAATIARL
jgi:hypothetical protein